MIEINNLSAGYGSSEVLHGIDMQLLEGEVVTLLGRNGMGKSTIINCILGLLDIRSGSIEFNGEILNQKPSYQIARLGIGWVPEERHIFPNLTVTENLLVAAANYSSTSTPWTLAGIFELFPRLQERQNNAGNQLSGGEQQMLAIGRALMINPKLLVLDEATEGLAPLICQEIWQVIRQLKAQGQSILIVDKNLNTLLKIADRYYLIEKGQVVSEGLAQSLASDTELQSRYLGV
ncbi:MAG: branched-chain amino acid transport system ATP-binding protein [Gammaproteobacteria bacterium]|jgi:branched-chain amino acid transport system ATP-binding protein